MRDHFEGYLNDTLPEEISAGNSNATRESRVSVFAIRHSTRKRREEQINELIAKSEDEDEKQSRLALVNPSNVMVMSSSDEDDEDTDDEEEEENLPHVPDLIDTDNTDDSDDEGAGNSNDSGRSSPEQPECSKGSSGSGPPEKGHR